MRFWIFLFVSLTLSLTPVGRSAVAADDAAAAFDKIVKLCEAGKEQAVACEKSVWNFADVAKDGKLTVAELSRLARFFGEAFDRKMAAGGNAGAVPKDLNTLPAALIFGPLSAQLLISNFDYDADGSISREELYSDFAEGQFANFVERVTKSGKQAIGQASGSLFPMIAQGALGAPRGGGTVRMGSAMPKPPSTAMVTPAPSAPASGAAATGGLKIDPGPGSPVTLGDWSSKLVTNGPTPYFEIAYTLNNAAAVNITRVDGVITFRDQAGTPFMSIHVAKDKGVPAKGTARLSGNYPVNPANADHMKLRDLTKASIRADLSVGQVTMENGESLRF